MATPPLDPEKAGGPGLTKPTADAGAGARPTAPVRSKTFFTRTDGILVRGWVRMSHAR